MSAEKTDNVVDIAKGTRRRARKVRALAIPIKTKKSADGADPDIGATTQEEFKKLEKDGKLVEPPFDPFALTLFRENNSEMNQVVDAMVTNVVGFGQQLVPMTGVKDGEDIPPDVEKEWEKFDEFLTYGNWDGGSLTEVRKMQRKDLEDTGNSFLELITNSKGTIIGYKHAPSYLVRLAVKDPTFTPYKESRIVGRGENRRVVTRTKQKRFRRYVMIDSAGSHKKVVWFKELGDPRNIHRKTGEVIQAKDLAKAKRERMLANPMLHRKIYAPRTPYGVPRYIGNMLAILGGRAAEEINYTTFRNNQIPSMMIMVSNGQLTQDTIERISDFSANVIQGDDNRSKFLIVEGEPDDIIDGDKPGGGHMKIDVKELNNSQHNDAMFVEYETANSSKIRRAWRLAPIYTGQTDDYTRATAMESRRITEEQVFAPERADEDWDWNSLLRHMGMKFHELRTNSPNVSRDEDLINVMQGAERSGAMTPRIAHKFLEDIMGHTLPRFDESVIDPDVPFSMQMAEAVKNQAQPNEVGQQVTALKEGEGDEDEQP